MDKFGKHADLLRAYDQKTKKSYGPRATMRRMLKNPAGSSELMQAIMSTSANQAATARNLPSFDRPENEVIDLRN